MITQLNLDIYQDGKRIASAGTPVRFIEFEVAPKKTPTGRDELVSVKLPNGQQITCDAAAVSSGIHSPEETLSRLARLTGIREDTLLKAAQQSRLMARKSGATWLSTLTAIEWAIAEGKIKIKNNSGLLRLGAWEGFEVGDKIKFLAKTDLSGPAMLKIYLGEDPRRRDTDIVKFDVFPEFWK